MAIPSAFATYDPRHHFFIPEKDIDFAANQNFSTHFSKFAEIHHRLNEYITFPFCAGLQLLSYIVEPLPGKDKDCYLMSMSVRVTCISLLLLIPRKINCLKLIMALGSLAISSRYVEHQKRPVISLLYTPSTLEKESEHLELKAENPMHIRTHNLGLVPNFFNIISDLRTPIERTHEIIHSILISPHQPDIIFFQEAFHEDALKLLCEGIRDIYPYIIHSIMPQISGWSSGAMIASKYAIKEIEFERLDDMIGIEKICPRIIIKIRVTAKIGELLLYGVHMQPLLGKDRAIARHKQLKQIKIFMEKDLEKYPKAIQLLVGDFNTSRVTEWGEDNIGQFEEPVLKRLSKYFHEFYLEDHDVITGKRTKNSPLYLKDDNTCLKVHHLLEPIGSWYRGPFANKGYFLDLIDRIEQWYYDSKGPLPIPGVVLEKSVWGTNKWYYTQATSPACLDKIVTPQKNRLAHPLGRIHCHVEIRRSILPYKTQSASSDHLIVDGKVWVKT